MKGKPYNMHCTLRRINYLTELLHMTGLKLYERSLSTIQHLQKANKMVQKQLTDTYTHMDIKMLICQIRQQRYIDYDHFNAVYTDFVERKRQSILKEINRIDTQFMAELRRRNEAGLPNKGMLPETQMEKAVLETLYVYLKDDDAYQQRAFKLYLNKKMEQMTRKGASYSRIKYYLEDKCVNSNYDTYTEFVSTPLMVDLSDLWIEFLKSGAGYKDIIPEELPHVAYFNVDVDIPCFIFDKPYEKEYDGEEFCRRFVQEYDTTHYNPHYDEDCDEPVDCVYYDDELADKPEMAYRYYMWAVNKYKRIQQRLKTDKGGER